MFHQKIDRPDNQDSVVSVGQQKKLETRSNENFRNR